MWELDCEEGWALKDWCFWTVVLEKTLESPLDCKEIKSVNPKGNQSWIFIGRIDAEAEAPILWPSDVKSWLIRKDPDDGKDRMLGSRKAGLKISLQKTKIRAPTPITSWQTDGGKGETVTDFLFWGCKITINGDCIHEIGGHLLFGRKLWQT